MSMLSSATVTTTFDPGRPRFGNINKTMEYIHIVRIGEAETVSNLRQELLDLHHFQ